MESVRFRVLSCAMAALVLLYVLQNLLYPGNICFILYGIERFVKALVMCEVIVLTSAVISVDRKYTSLFISILSYLAVILFFIDTITPGGRLVKDGLGVYFVSGHLRQQALYFVYYAFYAVILIRLAVYKGTAADRKREKREFALLILTYVFSAAGFVIEQFITAYRLPYIPVATAFGIAALILLKRLLVYHQSITVTPEDFEKEFDSGRRDVVFILDSGLNIIYQNMRAGVLSQLYGDEYTGRRITDVFSFSRDACSQLLNATGETAFGLTADYTQMGRQVNMVISHRLDDFGEILATVCYVYNMEDFEATDILSVSSEENDGDMIENAVEITRDARVLIVDDDMLFLNTFSRILKPYEVLVTRAAGGREALDAIKNHIFDIIFVSYEMENGSGADIVSRIRNAGGDYCGSVPIVFTTTADINDVFTGFLEAGFNDYLEKPVSGRALGSVLTRWLWARTEEEAAG